MSKKPKGAKNHPPPNEKKREGEKESTNRHVYIEPGVKIDLVEDLKNQQQTSDTNRAARENSQLLWSKITTVLLFLTALFAGWQAHSSRTSADAAASAAKTAHDTLELTLAVNRPSVLVDQVWTKNTPDGGMDFGVLLRNGSEVPATSFVPNCKQFLNNQPMVGATAGAVDMSIPAKPIIFAAHAVDRVCGAIISKSTFTQIENGTLSLDVYVEASYDGPVRSYTYCAKEHYHPTEGGFVNLGTCDPSKPFPQ
jgi:hypothetical protein